MFKEYHKIHRLGKEEVEGILDGKCFISEKIDGASTVHWLEDGVLHTGTRTRDITDKDDFNGLKEVAKNNVGINNYLKDNPTHILYCEYLIRHTISYKETSYKKLYLFDIWDGTKYLPADYVFEMADKYGIEHPHQFAVIDNPTVDQLKEYIGVSMLGEKGEGIVIKNFDFINKFGDLVYAKMVTEQFKEDNAVIFGGNNKHSETYNEMYVTNKYCTLERMRKIMGKVEPTLKDGEHFDMCHIPRICNSMLHDILTENIWEIQKKIHNIDFKVLQRVVYKKAKTIYVDVINDSLSVAYGSSVNVDKDEEIDCGF